ncbi:MAG: HAMP domain-containing protein [Alphaproteobacteria bacterium]|nr:HAMP domain-containing protein [Alphaproteobacteria bacterium]
MAFSLKTYLPHSLFGRAILILVTPLIIVQGIAAFVFYDRVWDVVTRRLTTAVAGEIGMVVQLLGRYPDPATRNWVFETVANENELRFNLQPNAILSNDGPALGSGILEQRLVNAMNERVRRPYRLNVWGDPADVLIDVQLPEGVLYVRTPRGRLFTTTSYVFILWMVGSSLIMFAIASVFMRNQVRPIQQLAAAAEEFGKGRDTPDFKPYGAAEVRRAAAAFVIMRERIRRFVAQRTEMLAGVSHDLRTPLTRMKLELAMLGDSPSVAGLKTDVGDMERMVESYLAFVRGEGEEQTEPTDLSKLLEDIATNARRDGNSVSLTTVGDLTVPLRPQAIKRSLTNLVANATRHAAQVAIAAERHNRAVEVVIDDDGPGIPLQAREEVFKPFYRLDPSRNPDTGGVGLGLTIARDVVSSHGGNIQLDTSPMGGLRARIRLPV